MKRVAQILAIIMVLVFALFACRTYTGFIVEKGNSDLPVTTVDVTPNTSVTSLATSPVSIPVAATLPPALDLGLSQDVLIRLYDRASPGVVALRVLTLNGRSLGSGFVIDKEGHIVTNYHVVKSQADLEVAFSSGFKVRGDIVGMDPDSDLAVLQVDAPPDELYPLPLGDSDQVKVGQMVVAIGNPFGLEGTMTIGIVSGLGRTLRSLRTTTDGTAFTVGDVIQTDAAINPGNSGGPLLNLNGEVIGVNESIITSGGDVSNSGVGFAISVNMVKRIVPALIAKGKFDYPYLGIFSIASLTLLEQEALDLPRSIGVYITEVVPGGPADQAGLRAGDQSTNISGVRAGGDLIIAVDGQSVLDFNDLITYIVKNKVPGDTVMLTVLRGPNQIDLELRLAERPSE